MTFPWELDDKPHEECGVFGIYAPGLDVSRVTFFGLFALQHRGQESAGIAATDGGQIGVRRNLGLVAQAFDEDDIESLPGHAAIGHTRYSTAGSTLQCNAGPMYVETELGPIAIAHNGNLTNAVQLRQEMEQAGEEFVTTTDSEVLARMIALANGFTIAEKIRNAMPKMIGAFSLAVLTTNELFAVRDGIGVRPLCIGKLDQGYVVASESCALMTIGAEFIREVEPGEIIRIDATSCESLGVVTDRPPALCLLELVYFARPDSQLMGERLHMMRQNMGRQLWREAPVDADVVVGLPDSATPAAIGYARESGIPYSEALIKNRYIGRTFIQPNQQMRQQAVRLKFNVLPEVVEGKRVVLVDDTIVRGTTSRPIVDLVRSAGAKEVHMRVHAPAIMWPCYLGVDLAKREELIAARMTIPEIAQHIGVDSLEYLSLEGLMDAIGKGNNRFCHACMTGHYPVKTFSNLDKLALEVS
ncbi:MAG: amidophosphoribosyltransferase [Thermomicrobiales bacterium]|nr:amidophosphoribosyltransferase [Thermomicrobiales bacterium]MCO5218478.1 amidophosphoribosyltransferase [Thermomicrobiales bacterium]MCO5228581.1 amidophosphoribosyltransferase [Thermomicrobiales bacterium]